MVKIMENLIFSMDDLGGNYHYFSETPTWIPYQFVASPPVATSIAS